MIPIRMKNQIVEILRKSYGYYGTVSSFAEGIPIGITVLFSFREGTCHGGQAYQKQILGGNTPPSI